MTNYRLNLAPIAPEKALRKLKISRELRGYFFYRKC
jgi:hypothetical protein